MQKNDPQSMTTAFSKTASLPDRFLLNPSPTRVDMWPQDRILESKQTRETQEMSAVQPTCDRSIIQAGSGVSTARQQ